MVLHNADCLEVMADMSANSVDAIITDPPYYKVKGEAWDNALGEGRERGILREASSGEAATSTDGLGDGNAK